MSMTEVPFDKESELDDWIKENLESFVPGAISIPGHQVSTTTGKRGTPDGFAFNLQDRQWFVIESDLLRHGVWTHIAEQIVRFVVAMQNPDTRRQIRDYLFEALIERDLVAEACETLETSSERLLQQLELFIEGIDPQVLIFIDDTNQDLHDMAQALSAPIKIFRVKKFIVNSQVEYHSPDSNAPILATEPQQESVSAIPDYAVIELMGGGESLRTEGRFKFYRMDDGSVIHIKRSKYYPRHDYYWYGITPSVLERCNESGVTHIVFVMGQEGYVKVPTQTVVEFVSNTRTSGNEDGSVRHYHCLISPGPDPELYFSQEVPRFVLSEHYQTI